jgi:uncharacterized protein YbaR (Trm112 family)
VFVELIDQLRCPRPHEESWLVASATHTEGRDIMQGVLGCPVCLAEYPIVEGIVRFGEPPAQPDPPAPDETEAMRLAALLDLGESHGYALIDGSLAVHAALVHRLTGVQLMLVNPPPTVAVGAGISGLTTAGDIPLARASARAAAVAPGATPAHLSSALSAVRPGGRLLGPVSLQVPAGAAEIARDERAWIAHLIPRPLTLERARTSEERNGLTAQPRNGATD